MDNPGQESVKSRTFMKKSPITTVLLVVVCVLGVAVAVLGFAFDRHFKTLKGLAPLISNYQSSQNLVNALANDALEYSKHNPAIDPILRPVGVKPLKPENGKAK